MIRFLVRFDEGTLIDGSDTRVISGRYISLIRGKYYDYVAVNASG